VVSENEAVVAIDVVFEVGHEPLGAHPDRRTSASKIGSVARPSIVVEVVDIGQIERIAVDIAKPDEEMAVGLDGNGVEPAAEEVAVTAVMVVEVTPVRRAEIVDELGQAAGRAAHQQMEVVRHEAIGVDLDTVPVARHAEQSAEVDPALVVEEDRLVIDSPVHHVIPAARRLRPT
jgi:hypothetical protein